MFYDIGDESEEGSNSDLTPHHHSNDVPRTPHLYIVPEDNPRIVQYTRTVHTCDRSITHARSHT